MSAQGEAGLVDLCAAMTDAADRIGVKSTSGMGGLFEWSMMEFEKVLRERARYEFWRVCRATCTELIAKFFPNPG